MEGMRKSFGNITWDGVADVGAQPPRIRPKRLDSEYEPGFGSKAYFKKRAKTCCTEKTMKRKLPVTNWLPKYNSEDFIGDLVAGITVFFTIIPQCIAFSELATVPAQYGLYSGFIGSFVYIFLGTTKQITIGPAAVICILLGGSLYETPDTFKIAFISVLCFIAGAFAFIMGFFKMGVFVQFISAPCVAAFITAAAIVIIVSQMKSLLGLQGVHGEQLVELVPQTWNALPTMNYSDMYLAVGGCVVLILMQEMKSFNWKRVINDTSRAEKFTHITFIVSSARNAIVLVALSVVAYYMNSNAGKNIVSMTNGVEINGILPPAVPTLYLPAFNDTVHGTMKSFPNMGLLDILKMGGSSVIIIPLICVVEQIAVCKSFSKARPVDVNQEMISLGVTQLISGFFHSMPVTGSICRSCVTAVSGVRTPLNGLWSGILVMVTITFFANYVSYIPKPALGAIVVCAVVHMIEYEEVIHIWQTKKRDMLPLVVTFVCCCTIGLEWGFLIGVIVNVIMLLVFAATPAVPILKFTLSSQRRVVILKPDRSLHYPGVEVVRNLITKKALKHQDALIVVDCVNLIDIDFTGAKALGSVADALKERDQKIVFVNVSHSVDCALRGYTHGGVETYETAQQWIDTLSDTRDKHAIIRSLSSLEERDTFHHVPYYPHTDGGFLSVLPPSISIEMDETEDTSNGKVVVVNDTSKKNGISRGQSKDNSSDDEGHRHQDKDKSDKKKDKNRKKAKEGQSSPRPRNKKDGGNDRDGGDQRQWNGHPSSGSPDNVYRIRI